MYPLDPIEPGSASPKPPMAPPYVDEDPDLEMTRKGLRVAENEKRDSVTEEYEKQAASDDDPEEALDDIEYPKGGAEGADPEVSAIRKTPSADK